MKATYKDETLAIPANVTVDVKSRVLRVKGPRGTLTKDLNHLNMEILKKDQTISFQVWHGKRKHVACLRTARALIANLITGVTKGYEFRMRYVYAHFPINVVINNGNVEIRNFLGEKIIRRVALREGVTCEISTDLKDELILRGNSLENVSQTAADIQQSTAVKRKDIRKFLDGIYVSEKGAMKGTDE